MTMGQCRKGIIALLIAGFFTCFLQAQNPQILLDRSLEFSSHQLFSTVSDLLDYSVYGDSIYPRSTLHVNGKWKPMLEGHWASGFLPGCLWYMFYWTSDTTWKGWAESWTQGVEHEQYRNRDHEAGFIIYRSYGLGYKFTQNTAYKAVIIEAAHSLATRYNPTVGCIRSWDNRYFPVIIDGMMVLETLFWAAKNGGDANLYNIALSHALKTRENNVRSDGSNFQIVDYNPLNGSVISRTNKQGYSDSTTWSRGQAWGIYGFSVAYRETKDSRFLETAQKLADYFINNLPSDHIPYWDFKAPNIPNEEKDVSAAAISASGLLELSTLIAIDSLQKKYYDEALNILVSLSSSQYLAEGTNSKGILLHGVGNRMNQDPIAGEVDVSLIYADHFFIEALLRYKQLSTSVDFDSHLRPRLPSYLQLFQNYPNPFNSQTSIKYELFINSDIDLSVFSLFGVKVKTLKNQYEYKGVYTSSWDGRDDSGNEVATGVYYYRLLLNKEVEVKSAVLIK